MEKKKNAEIRKPEIIKAFYEQITEEGFEGASIAKVAKRLGINSTLILHYFGNKENMTFALVDHVIYEYSKIFKKFRKDSAKADDKLENFVKTIWSKKYYNKMSIASSFSVLSTSFRNRKIEKKVKGLYETFKNYLVIELKDLESKGLIKPQDFEKTAEVLLSMIEGCRHFHVFFIMKKDTDTYNKNIASVVLNLLKDPSWQDKL